MEVNNQEFKKDIFRLALFVGELMLKNGAETFRVEETVLKMCCSRGFKHVTVFVTPTVIIISDDRFDGISFMKTINSREINLSKVDALNSFSRKFVGDVDIDTKEARKELKKIEAIKEYGILFRQFATGIGSGSFALLLGCTFTEFVLSVLVSMLSVHICNKVFAWTSVSFFTTLAAAFGVAFVSSLLTEVGIIETPNMLIIGSIMPLLPGMIMIKSLSDLLSGNLMTGSARLFEFVLTAIAIAIGVGFALEIFSRFGGVL